MPQLQLSRLSLWPFCLFLCIFLLQSYNLCAELLDVEESHRLSHDSNKQKQRGKKGRSQPPTDCAERRAQLEADLASSTRSEPPFQTNLLLRSLAALITFRFISHPLRSKSLPSDHRGASEMQKRRGGKKATLYTFHFQLSLLSSHLQTHVQPGSCYTSSDAGPVNWKLVIDKVLGISH